MPVVLHQQDRATFPRRADGAGDTAGRAADHHKVIGPAVHIRRRRRLRELHGFRGWRSRQLAGLLPGQWRNRHRGGHLRTLDVLLVLCGQRPGGCRGEAGFAPARPLRVRGRRRDNLHRVDDDIAVSVRVGKGDDGFAVGVETETAERARHSILEAVLPLVYSDDFRAVRADDDHLCVAGAIAGGGVDQPDLVFAGRGDVGAEPDAFLALLLTIVVAVSIADVIRLFGAFHPSSGVFSIGIIEHEARRGADFAFGLQLGFGRLGESARDRERASCEHAAKDDGPGLGREACGKGHANGFQVQV